MAVMTVKDLIERLTKLPEDATIELWGGYNGEGGITVNDPHTGKALETIEEERDW